MAATTKIERLIDQVSDALNQKFSGSCVKSYDASHDAYLTMTVGGAQVALIKFGTVAQLASGQGNPITGLTDTVFVPDVVRVGLDGGTKAQGNVTQAAPNAAGAVSKGTVTVGVDLTTGDAIDINGSVFTAKDTGAGANEFDIVGVQASGTATLLANLTAGDAGAAADVLTINTHGFTMKNAGAAGDEINLTGTPANGSVVVGVDLTEGDKVTLVGTDFASIDTGAAGNQWNIVGVKATGTIILAGVLVNETLTIQGVTFTATAATQDANGNFVFDASMITSATNLVTAITANAVTSALVTADNAAGTSATVTITFKKKGTSGNAFTIATGTGGVHYTCSGATLGTGTGTPGSVNTASCATNLANAIVGSITAGITGVYDAMLSAGECYIFAYAIGTLHNGATLAYTGGATHLSGPATLTGGALNLNACATSLAAAITASVTGGIAGVVDATSTGLSAIVTITADKKGTSGNVALAQTGANFTLSGAALANGAVTIATCATNLAASVNASIDPLVASIYAKAVAAVVTTYSKIPGVAGDGLTLSDAGGGGATHLLKSGANFAGGTAGNKLVIHGATFESVKNADYAIVVLAPIPEVGPGTQYFDESTTDILQAGSLAAVINASVDPLIAGIVTAAAGTGASNKKVFVTAVASGIAGNFITFTESGSMTGITGAGFLGHSGADTGVSGVDGLTSPAIVVQVSATCTLLGTEVRFYQKGGIVLADLTDETLLVGYFNSLQWGFLNQQ